MSCVTVVKANRSSGAPAERVERVVVLMFENRSFDHMLGFLDGPDENR
jgi:phospholipase C